MWSRCELMWYWLNLTMTDVVLTHPDDDWCGTDSSYRLLMWSRCELMWYWLILTMTDVVLTHPIDCWCGLDANWCGTDSSYRLLMWSLCEPSHQINSWRGAKLSEREPKFIQASSVKSYVVLTSFDKSPDILEWNTSDSMFLTVIISRTHVVWVFYKSIKSQLTVQKVDSYFFHYLFSLF